MADSAEEQRLLQVQRNYLELEMRKFKRKKIIYYHDLENQLLRDVSTKVWLKYSILTIIFPAGIE